MKKIIQWFKNVFLGEANSDFFYQTEEVRFENASDAQRIKFLTNNNKAS